MTGNKQLGDMVSQKVLGHRDDPEKLSTGPVQIDLDCNKPNNMVMAKCCARDTQPTHSVLTSTTLHEYY